MGQYYKPCLLATDYKTSENPIIGALNCYAYHAGGKLMEHSYVGTTFTKAACAMLKGNKDKPFVWGGDYGDPINRGENAYSLGRIDDFDVKYGEEHIGKYDDVKKMPIDKYIINHTTKEYVVVPKLKRDEDFVIHPLPILTCDGNGRGGGDLYNSTDEEFIGIWAYNVIESANKVPSGYKKLDVHFVETY